MLAVTLVRYVASNLAGERFVIVIVCSVLENFIIPLAIRSTRCIMEPVLGNVAPVYQ